MEDYIPHETPIGRLDTTIPSSGFQVDLLKSKRLLRKLLHKGRNSGHNQWIKSYKLAYSNDGTNWTDYNNGQILTGNNDKTSVVKNTLDEFEARYVRFKPQTWNTHISARFEIYVDSTYIHENDKPSTFQLYVTRPKRLSRIKGFGATTNVQYSKGIG